MQEQDGPYKNTRSSTGSQGKNSDKGRYGEKHTPSKTSETDKSNISNTPICNRIEKERVRTPSGHLISTPVKDIRDFFLSSHEAVITPFNSQKANRAKRESEVKQKGHSIVNRIQSTVNSDAHEEPKQTQDNWCEKVTISYDEWRESVKRDKAISGPTLDYREKVLNKKQTDKEDQTEQMQDPRQLSAISDPFVSVNASVKNKQNMSQEGDDSVFKDGAPQKSLSDIEVPSDPKVMDLQIVIQMFKEIKKDLNTYKEEVPNDKLKKIIETEDENAKAIKKLKDEIKKEKEDKRVMAGTIKRMSTVMNEMEEKINELEKQSYKDQLILSGFPTIENRSMRNKQVEKLFQEAMKIKVKITDSFLIGENVPRAVVLVFATNEDRNLAYYNKAKLKDFVGPEDNSFYLNERLPQAIMERKRKERNIYKQNNRNTASKIEMSFFKGSLRIQNERYSKRVVEPTPSDFIGLEETELKMIMATKIQPGKQITLENSVFTGYGIKATTHSEIRRAYIKMKLGFPEARHIMCGYRIPGMETHYTEDSCDDGEFAGGQAILNQLQTKGYKNLAVFVVRQYGGTRLGKKRFDIIKQAAQYAVEQLSNVDRSPPRVERRQESDENRYEERQTEESDKRQYEENDTARKLTYNTNEMNSGEAGVATEKCADTY